MSIVPFMEGAPITAIGLFIGGFVALNASRFSSYASLGTVLCSMGVVFQVRILERRLGSIRYLLLLFWPLSCAIFIGRSLHLAASTFKSGDFALLALSCALLVRYISDVPALGPKRHRLSDKWFALFCAAKLAFFDCLLHGSVHSRAVSVIVGLTVGYALGPKRLGRTWVLRGLDSVHVVRRAVAVVASLISGGEFTIKHIAPEPPVEQPTDDADLRAAIQASLAPHGAPHSQGGSAPTMPSAVDQAMIDLLVNMGLGCTREEAAQALSLTGGNPDAAAALLMDSR